MRRFLAPAAVLFGFAALPAAAGAHATVSTQGGEIIYASRDAISQNTLTMTVQADRIRFKDTTVDGGIDPGPCDPGEVDANGWIIEVICPRGGKNVVRIDVADREDKVTVREAQGAPLMATQILGGVGSDGITGGSATDQIDPGVGEDQVDSGAGDDDIRLRDGSPDKVICGPGDDRVEVEPADTVDPSCETVDRAHAPPGGGTPPPNTGPDTTAPVVEGGALTLQRIARTRTLRVYATASEVAELAASGIVTVGGSRLTFSPARRSSWCARR